MCANRHADPSLSLCRHPKCHFRFSVSFGTSLLLLTAVDTVQVVMDDDCYKILITDDVLLLIISAALCDDYENIDG